MNLVVQSAEVKVSSHVVHAQEQGSIKSMEVSLKGGAVRNARFAENSNWFPSVQEHFDRRVIRDSQHRRSQTLVFICRDLV